MTGMRTIFVVLVPADGQTMPMSHNMPTNQTLGQVLQIMLALPDAVGSDVQWGEPDSHLLVDMYGVVLDPGIFVRQVPNPGCVFAVSRELAVDFGGKTLTGDQAAETVAAHIAMGLFKYQENEEDPVSRRYAKFIRGGLWRFEPTPITAMDLGLCFHEEDAGPGEELREQLASQGVKCSTRVVRGDGTSSLPDDAISPAEDARALVVVVSEAHKTDPWIAYDVGCAWAKGIPVVPVLVGEWESEPPNILAPYQMLSWDRQRDRTLSDLLEFLDLKPWRPPGEVGGPC